MQQISERILLTIWVGGMWIIGPVVAPTLFKMLDDRSLAGMVAGQLFTTMSYIGLFCGGMLLLSHAWSSGKHIIKSWRAWLLVVMLGLIVTGEFVISPKIVAIRDAGMPIAEMARFGLLHRTASSLFMVCSLAGLILVIFGVNRNRQQV